MDISSMSMEDQQNQIYSAFSDMAAETEMPSAMELPDLCLVETYPTFVIVCLDDKYYQVNYADTDGEIEFDTPDKWIPVEHKEEWATKARHIIKTKTHKVLSVKAIQDGDEWKIEMLGVPFGGPRNGKDIEGQFFDKTTNIHAAEYPEIPVTYFHTLDANNQPTGEPEYIGKAKYERTDERGHWYTAILDKSKEFASRVWEAAKAGFAAASSETLPHLIRAEGNGHITNWPVAGMALLDVKNGRSPVNSYAIAMPAMKAIYKNAGLTLNVTEQSDKQSGTNPTPDKAEAIKAQSTGEASDATKSKQLEKKMENIMEISEEKLIEITTKAADAGADKAVKAFVASQPATNDGGHVVVTMDEADRPFKNLAENARAVKAFELSKGQEVHPRIKYLKAATGASEGVPSDGGLLLDPTLTAEFVKPLHEEGTFSADIRMLPVSGNSNYGWINGVDETSRATGSRWGGIRGYRLAEATTITGSKPTFRRINWELKKYACLVYGTDELLLDASLFSAVVNQGCREELSFMFNDDIVNGPGTAGAQGFLNSGALISIPRVAASAIVGADISAMWQRQSVRSKGNAKWYVNSECAPQLDALFAVGSTAVLFPYAGYTADGVRTLYGRPIVETEFSAALGTTGDISLCDMSQYLGWEKVGVESATSIHLQFLTDETTFRFIYRSDGKSSLAAPMTPYKGTLTHSPFVTLSSATA